MSARRDDDPPADPLAGATIVVHDLSKSGAGVPAHGRSAGASGEGAAAAPGTAGAAPTTGSPATTSDRWWPLRYVLVATAFGLFGYYAHATWQGRPPTPITFGTLGAAPKVEIRVHVDGAVAQPGVYKLAQGDRVEDAIKAAGGLASHADQTRLNMAQRVRDEQRLDVPALPNTVSVAFEALGGAQSAAGQAPSSGSTDPPSTGSPQPAPTTSSASQPSSAARPTTTPRPQATTRPTSTPRPQPTARATSFAGGRINVNTATQAQLEQLPGFGATSAQRILTYRAANGPLRSLDDVRKAGVQEQFVRQAAEFLAFD